MARSRRPAPSRITWLHWLALVLGLLVLLGHVVTLKPPRPSAELLSVKWQDLLAHFAMLLSFTLAYRLSFRGDARLSNRAALWVCSLWGALCEVLQYWIPARDFNLVELAVNVLTPALTVGLFAWWGRK